MRFLLLAQLLTAALFWAGCAGEGSYELNSDSAPAGRTTPLPFVCEQAPQNAPARLLTRVEYDNTVRDLLGDDPRPASALFPAEPRVAGFENNATAHQVNPLLVRNYLAAAEGIAARAREERMTGIVGCDPAVIGSEPCAAEFLERFLLRAYRRPPTEAEREALTTFFRTVERTEGFDGAVEWTIQVVLQSPQFLYRVEHGGAFDGTVAQLTPWEMASRLSYFLWSSMPDDLLLDAARTGELATEKGIEKHARRMLADARSRETVQSFFRQWLNLDGIELLEKNTARHPEFTPEVAVAWRRGLELFIDDAWNGGGNVEALFNSPAMFVDAHSAPLYGMAVPEPDGYQRMEMPGTQRRGLLTQPGLLAALADGNESSPVRRGVFVRERFLCDVLPPPPPNIAIVAPDPDPNATTRERFAEHTANPTCSSCHQRIDPLGFGFEQYDALGRFRETENGRPIDASGEVVDARDPALEGPFVGATELAQRFARSTRVQDCVAVQWFRFAMARLEAEGDGCSLLDVKTRFTETDGDFRELLVAITRTSAFRTRRVTP